MKINPKKWIRKLTNKWGIHWKKWGIIIALGFGVTITSLMLRIVNSLVSDANINSVYYMYLTDNNVLLWLAIYLLLTMYYRDKKESKSYLVNETLVKEWDNKHDEQWNSEEK